MDYALVEPRGKLIEVHIADIHFGAIDPKTEYDILTEQFTKKIVQLPVIDLISIDGDLFDHKCLANSDIVYYASKFVNDLVGISYQKHCTLLLLAGTQSHDAGQLKLFYHYLEDPNIDIRIVENIRFETVKGAKILCVPELYGVPEEVYQTYFKQTDWYDEAICHGTFEGSVYGNNVGAGRLLTPDDFLYCKGPVISGHVHKPGCFSGFYYYTGCPIRYKFGEEESKGWLLVLHDLDSRLYNIEFEEIISFRYDTIFLDELVSTDPKQIIDYINNRKINDGIDFIKVKFRVPIDNSNKTIINNYYRNNSSTFVEFLDNKELEKQKMDAEIARNDKYSYLMDNSLSDFEKFVQYINEDMGYKYITVDKLTEMLKEEI
jgi:hypothetical protein